MSTNRPLCIVGIFGRTLIQFYTSKICPVVMNEKFYDFNDQVFGIILHMPVNAHDLYIQGGP